MFAGGAGEDLLELRLPKREAFWELRSESFSDFLRPKGIIAVCVLGSIDEVEEVLFVVGRRTMGYGFDQEVS